MIRRILSIVIIGASVATVACAPVSRFEWGTYEQALYAYSQNPENRPVYKLSLETAIERGRARNAVAPGMLAELGFLYLEDGNVEQAVKAFQEERSLFPESAVFMDRVIRQSGAPATVAGGQN